MHLFSHDLPKWGETLSQSVKRIVKNQLDVEVKNIDVLDLEMQTYPDELHKEGNKQWAITLYVLAELNHPPICTKDVTEVISFDHNKIPNDMAWWTQDELKEFLEENE